jgi:hypothetical protein
MSHRNPLRLSRFAQNLPALAFIPILLISIGGITIYTVTADAAVSVPSGITGTGKPLNKTTRTDTKLSDAPAGLQVAYQQARHQIEEINPAGQPRHWQAINPRNKLNIRFDGEAIEVSSVKQDWHLRMQLSAVGDSQKLTSVEKAKVRLVGNRLSYDRGVIEEWYINDPSGLEQGFTVARPLSDISDEELILELKLSGDVSARLVEQGKALQLSTSTGQQLRYEGLKSWDAEGTALASVLQLAGNTLHIQVNVEHAKYPIVIDPWLVEEGKLVATDAAAHDHFGISVAISGTTALVGTNHGFATVNFSGSAYVFTRTGSSWSQQAKLDASDAAINDHFGGSVAISGDTAVVGAAKDEDAGSSSGSAYVFTRNGSIWTEQAKLTASDAAADDLFGTSVSVWGNTALVGAFGDDDAGSSSGSAYAFTRTGSIWTEQAKLTASDAAANDFFGRSVAISGNTAVVGADGDDDGSSASGSAYVFTRTGSIWTEQAKLTASDAAADDSFGRSVAVSGNRAVVGAYLDDDGGLASGSAYVFTRTGSIWTEQAKLVASDAAARDNFGTSVSVWGDTAVVGASSDDDADINSGSAYTFDLSCTAARYVLPDNQWHQISLPCNPGVNNTVADILGNGGLGVYGVDWVLWVYNPGTNAYDSVATSTVMQVGMGYWIKQITGRTQYLAMPNGSTPMLVTQPNGCVTTGCVEILLATQFGEMQWNMVGYPFASAQPLGKARVVTNSGVCINGCDLSTATAKNLVHNQAWTFDGSVYTEVNEADDVQPWIAYWMPVLSDSDGLDPVLLLGKP